MKTVNEIKKWLTRSLGGVPREEFAAHLRQFEAAQTSRLAMDWLTATTSVDQDLNCGGEALVARTRDQYKNSEWVGKYIAMVRDNIVGPCGMNIRWAAVLNGADGAKPVLDTEINRTLDDLLYEFGRKENLTVDASVNWIAAQRLAISTWAMDGEVFTYCVPDESSPFGMRLQFIDSTRVDRTYNAPLYNGVQIRMGIEQNAVGRPLAYHVLRGTKNEWQWGQNHGVNERIRIPAEHIIHAFHREFVGQSRGIPWAARSLAGLRQLVKAEEALVAALRVAAANMGFYVQKPDASGTYAFTGAQAQMPSDSAVPAKMEVLAQGLEPVFTSWQFPNEASIAAEKSFLRRASAGLNVSYNSLGNDMESVNFASGKMGKSEEQDGWIGGQNLFASEWVEPVLMKFLAYQILTGNLEGAGFQDFKRLSYTKINGRRWPSLNPVQEFAAHETALRLRLTSHSRIAAAMGLDRNELFDEIADDLKAAKERGLNLDQVDPDISEKVEVESEEDEATPADKPAKSGRPAKVNGSRNAARI